MVPEAQLDGCLQWAYLSSGHTGGNRSVDFFRDHFHSQITCAELRARMQSIVDSCGCHASKQSDSLDPAPVCLSPTALILCCTWISSPVCLRFVVMTAVWLSPVA